MMNRLRTDVLAPRLTIAALAASMALVGCEKKQPPPAPPPPPPVVKVPEPIRLDSLIQDKRVQFPQALAPADESLARAVVAFATALAKGDSAAFSAALDAPGKTLLDMQVSGGEWKQATEGLTAVRVVRLDMKGDGADLGLAVQAAPGADAAYLTAWRARQTDGKWVFGGMPVIAKSAATAQDLDGAELAPPVVKEEPKPEPKKTEEKKPDAEPAPAAPAPGSPPGKGGKPPL